jgi:hypothetical protein
MPLRRRSPPGTGPGDLQGEVLAREVRPYRRVKTPELGAVVQHG